MELNGLYDQLSSGEQYRLIARKNILCPKFPRSLFAFENRFLIVTSEIEKIIKNAKNKMSVLDIGCGDGIYEKLLSRECLGKAMFTGVDFSQKQLTRAAKYVNQTYRVDLDAEKLPVKNNSIDMVICSEVLEHLFFPEKTISEISHVLKPSGTLIITVPNVASLQTRLSLFFSGFSPMVNFTKNREHIRFYSLVDARQLIRNKFTITKERGIGSALFDHWNTTFKLPVLKIFQEAGDRFFPKLANGLLIIAKKK